MGLQHAEASINAINYWKGQVMAFGHLAPKPRQIYQGHMFFTHSDYGQSMCIKSDFKDLPDSPWFYEDLSEYLFNDSQKRGTGTVFKFEGYYQKFKNGNYRFVGKIQEVKLT